MNLISTFIFWTWLLGISLIIPTTLPAGGARKSIIEQTESGIRSPLIAFKEFNLLSSPLENSSILTTVKIGTPVKIIQVWNNSEETKWLLVNVLSRNYNQFFYRRGWVDIGDS